MNSNNINEGVLLMNELKEYNSQIFESIKHIDDEGIEFWKAIELMIALKYTKWSNFNKVIDKAKLACNLSQNNVSGHFADASKMVTIGTKEQRKLGKTMPELLPTPKKSIAELQNEELDQLVKK